MSKKEEPGQELQRLAGNVPVLQSLAELTAIIQRIETGVIREVDAVCERPLIIESDEDLEMMAAAVREARDVIDLVEERHGPIKKFADRLHKVITGQEGRLIGRLKLWIDGDRNTKGASQVIAAYQLEQQRKKEQAQRDAQALLDKEHDRSVAKQVKQLERAGEPALAQQVLQQKEFTRPVASAAPAASVAPVKQEYDYEITNADLVPRVYCCPDEPKIKKQVKLMGKDTQIAGVRVFPLDPKASVRR